MTAKRFTIKSSMIVDDVTVIIDNQKEYTFPVLDSTLNYMFCKVLNELHEKNIELHIQNDFLKDENQHMRKLVNENEQLKTTIQRLTNDNTKQKKKLNTTMKENDQLREIIKECRLNELHEENERLKKENSEYHKIVNCSNCHFHNYDWYDDGDEFEVCDKGNTERLVYHQFCKDWVEL